MYKSWIDFKAGNAATMDRMAQLKQEEIYRQNDLKEEIQGKLKKSEQVVEEFRQVQAHRHMLKMEQRKLMEEDMVKVHARQKRLATKKKNEILKKEHDDLSRVTEQRKEKHKLIDYRYRNRVQSMINSDQFNRSLDEWSKKGFAMSSLGK